MTTLRITHNAGFFSCCNIKLHQICNYINLRRAFPLAVDSSEQFAWYKPPGEEGDVTYAYFLPPNQVFIQLCNIPSTKIPVTIPYHHSLQFVPYDKIKYELLSPLIKKYFSPALEIQAMVQQLETKYGLDYANLSVLFYRGNDKVTETTLCPYEEYLPYANAILKHNPNTRFLIQSDESEFLQFMLSHFPTSSIVFYDEIRHMPNCVSTVDAVMKENIQLYSKYYLAITLIMAKCQYVVCGSGNCSMWVMFYRGNNKGVFQNLQGQWFVTPLD